MSENDEKLRESIVNLLDCIEKLDIEKTLYASVASYMAIKYCNGEVDITKEELSDMPIKTSTVVLGDEGINFKIIDKKIKYDA